MSELLDKCLIRVVAKEKELGGLRKHESGGESVQWETKSSFRDDRASTNQQTARRVGFCKVFSANVLCSLQTRVEMLCRAHPTLSSPLPTQTPPWPPRRDTRKSAVQCSLCGAGRSHLQIATESYSGWDYFSDQSELAHPEQHVCDVQIKCKRHFCSTCTAK